MQSLGVTKFKKLNPRPAYLAPYVQFPWNKREDLIGKEIEILEVEDGFFLKFVNAEFKRGNFPNKENPSSDIEERVLILERKIEQISSISGNGVPIKPCSDDPSNNEREGYQTTTLLAEETKLVNQPLRARGLVGYDVALTRRRSPVRIRPSPFLYREPVGSSHGFLSFLFTQPSEPCL